MWICVILISIIVAYLIRTNDIRREFKKVDIKVSLIDSLKILYLLTKNYIVQLITLKKMGHKEKQIKFLNRSFWLFFDTLLVSLTSILRNSFELIEKNEISVVKVSTSNSVTDNVSIAIPFVNSSMAYAA